MVSDLSSLLFFYGLPNVSSTSLKECILISPTDSLKWVSWKDWSNIKTEKRTRLEMKKMPAFFKQWKEKMCDLSIYKDRFISSEMIRRYYCLKFSPYSDFMTTKPLSRNVSTSSVNPFQWGIYINQARNK